MGSDNHIRCSAMSLLFITLSLIGSPLLIKLFLISFLNPKPYEAVAELKLHGPSLGPSHVESLEAANSLIIARCDHEKAMIADECIMEVIGKTNSEHFFVATQQADLRRRILKGPNPLSCIPKKTEKTRSSFSEDFMQERKDEDAIGRSRKKRKRSWKGKKPVEANS